MAVGVRDSFLLSSKTPRRYLGNSKLSGRGLTVCDFSGCALLPLKFHVMPLVIFLVDASSRCFMCAEHSSTRQYRNFYVFPALVLSAAIKFKLFLSSFLIPIYDRAQNINRIIRAAGQMNYVTLQSSNLSEKLFHLHITCLLLFLHMCPHA